MWRTTLQIVSDPVSNEKANRACRNVDAAVQCRRLICSRLTYGVAQKVLRNVERDDCDQPTESDDWERFDDQRRHNGAYAAAEGETHRWPKGVTIAAQVPYTGDQLLDGSCGHHDRECGQRM
jgi:hypothetical protein